MSINSGQATQGAGTALQIFGNLMKASEVSAKGDRIAGLYMDKSQNVQENVQYEIDTLTKMVDFNIKTLNADTQLKLTKQRRAGALESGALKAALGKSGVAFSGSAVQAAADVAAINTLSENIIEYNDEVQRTALIYNRDLKETGLLMQAQSDVEYLETMADETRREAASAAGGYMFNAFGAGLNFMASMA